MPYRNSAYNACEYKVGEFPTKYNIDGTGMGESTSNYINRCIKVSSVN